MLQGAAAALLLLAALALQATSLPVPRAPPPEPADSAVGGDYRLGDVRYPGTGPGPGYWYYRGTFDFCGGEKGYGQSDSPYCAPTRACGQACDIIWNDIKIVATLADAIAYVDAAVQPPQDPYDPPNPKAASVCCGEQYRLRSYLDECAEYPQNSNLTTCGQLPFGKVALALASVAASPNGGEIPLTTQTREIYTPTYVDAALALNSRMDLLSKETLDHLFYVSSSTISEVLASLRVAYVKKTAASWQGGARSPEPPQGAASPVEPPRE